MRHFAAKYGEDAEIWGAAGLLHDLDYEKWPEEHCKKCLELMDEAGIDRSFSEQLAAHGWGICTDVEPLTDMEKSLFTVDELTGIIQAAARMRPNGITDLNTKSFMKKFKDKKFAAKCDRELIKKGCELLGMEVRDVAEICIDGMRPHAEEIGLQGT
jgi:predicted hydrolase (HD superfamily)